MPKNANKHIYNNTIILTYYNMIYNKHKNKINYYLKGGHVSADGALLRVSSLRKMKVRIS